MGCEGFGEEGLGFREGVAAGKQSALTQSLFPSSEWRASG